MRNVLLFILILLAGVSAACSPTGSSDQTDTLAPDEVSSEVTDTPLPPTSTASPSPADITPTLCPRATPEWLRVRPVTSPTSELTQTIYISINNGESVTISTPAGEFEATAETGTLENPTFRYNYVAEIDLVPDSEQEISVQTKIRQIERDGCPYGGYPLTTKVDINFEPLVIIQESE